MNCNVFKKKGVLYLYGELSGKDTRLFKEHLEICPYCREEIKVFKETISIFKRKSMDKPSDQCIDAIYQKGHIGEVSFRRKFPFFPFNYRSPIFVFCSLVVVLGVAILFSYRKGSIFLKEEMSWQLASEVEKAMEDIGDHLDVLEWEINPYFLSFLNMEMEEIKTEMDELSAEMNKV